MSTSLQQRQSTDLSEAERNAIEVRVALNQNLWGMKDEQVWSYYRLMCQHLRLDPASKPFDIITDQKTQQKKLYPNTSCTAQLGDNARLSYGKLEIDVNQGMAALGFKVAHVALEVRHPNGRTLVAEAFVDLMSGWEGKALAGQNLVNALKKAGTQCRRRGTLQMLGLAAPSDEIPMVKLGDMERAEGDVDGVVIEHPPASVLNPADESEFTDEERAIWEAAREDETGEPVTEATQEEFWEVARERGVSSRDAAPLAKRASIGEISWSDAIRELPAKK
jgi:hypothetical protein